MQPCRATSAYENSDLLSQITTQLSGNPLWLYKDDSLRVIKSYSPHMQNVHVGSNIIFVLFIFYSHLPPDVARFEPTTRRRAVKSGCSYTTFASRNDARSSPPPPLPLFSFPLTTMPPLLFDTTSPPCSDPLPSQTSSPLHCHLWIPIALSSTGLDVVIVAAQSSSTALPPLVPTQDRKDRVRSTPVETPSPPTPSSVDMQGTRCWCRCLTTWLFFAFQVSGILQMQVVCSLVTSSW
jgi:hypothetical protein